MDSLCLKRLERGIELSKGPAINKLLTSPVKSIYSKILQIIGLKFGRVFRVKARTFWGAKMAVFLPEVTSLVYYRYGFNEEGVTKMLLKYLKQGMTFIDVGAHLGAFTLMASNIVGGKGQVHSFEPTPHTFEILSLNIKDRKRIYLNKCAAFSKSKIIYFNDYGKGYSAFNSFYEARLDSLKKISPKRYKVQAVSLDDYFHKKKIKPDFIKIDAESSEYEILLGMKKTIQNFKPIIILEVGGLGVKGIKNSRTVILFLIKKGYCPMEYSNGQIIKHHLKKKYSYGNILFLPSKEIVKRTKKKK